MLKFSFLFVIIGITFCNIKCNETITPGWYGGGILHINIKNDTVYGIIKDDVGNPEVSCFLKFNFINHFDSCAKSIVLIDPFGEKYNGIIELKRNGIVIKSIDEQGVCDRVMQLENGEFFKKD